MKLSIYPKREPYIYHNGERYPLGYRFGKVINAALEPGTYAISAAPREGYTKIAERSTIEYTSGYIYNVNGRFGDILKDTIHDLFGDPPSALYVKQIK